MDTKPKAKKAPRKKTAKTAKTQKEQSARFIKAAREAGVDESGKEFDKALEKLSSAKSRDQH